MTGRSPRPATSRAATRRLGMLIVACVAAAGGCSSPAVAGRPVSAVAPSSAPSPAATRPCDGFRAPEDVDPAGRLVAVNPHPIRATAVWLPGLNSVACRAKLTTMDTAEAVRLAAAINRAPPSPRGATACPADDATAVIVYFSYRHRAEEELADVSLSGCAGVGAPGRYARQLTPTIRHILAGLAPTGWARYLTR